MFSNPNLPILIFHCILFAFIIISLSFMAKNKAASKIYFVYGKNIAVVFALCETIVFLKKHVSSTFLLTIVPVNFVTLSVLVAGGMILCRKIDVPSIPYLIGVTRSRKKFFKTNYNIQLISIVLCSIFICSFTWILFSQTNPAVSDLIRAGGDESAISSRITWVPILFFVLIALYEEIIFRLFIQSFFSYLFRKIPLGWIAAIILTATLFAFGHIGVLATQWIKLTQTFIIGLVLGFLMRRYGMETSFAVHSVLNIFALYASQQLLS
jgi:membrane protease YdiL (CAAX protease family)